MLAGPLARASGQVSEIWSIPHICEGLLGFGVLVVVLMLLLTR